MLYRGTTSLLHDDRGLVCAVQPDESRPDRGYRADAIDFVVMFAMAAVFVGPAMFLALTQRRLIVAIPIVIVGGVVYFFLFKRWHTTRKRRAIEGLLLRGRCPACDYDISAAPRDDDGFTTCTECASAWRTEDFGRA